MPFWGSLLLAAAALLAWWGQVVGGLPGWGLALLDGLSNFSSVFLGIFIEAAPFLLLGTFSSGLVEVFVGRDSLIRWLPRNPLAGALVGSLMGLFFPVCECGVTPLARRMMHKGAPMSVAVAALLAAPVLNPIVIASTLAAFGTGPVLWFRLGATLVIAILVGLVFGLHPHPESLLRGEALPAPDLTLEMAQSGGSFSEKLRRVALAAADEFFEMGRFLVMGALLAALMQTIVRQSVLLGLGQGPVLSALVMILMAVLLSVCSTVDAFIALAFVGTFTTGSILAFLIYGPMVDIKSALMFLRVFRPRAAAYLALLPLAFTLLLSVFLNYGWVVK